MAWAYRGLAEEALFLQQQKSKSRGKIRHKSYGNNGKTAAAVVDDDDDQEEEEQQHRHRAIEFLTWALKLTNGEDPEILQMLWRQLVTAEQHQQQLQRHNIWLHVCMRHSPWYTICLSLNVLRKRSTAGAAIPAAKFIMT